MIIGILVGVMAAIILVLAIVLLWIRHRPIDLSALPVPVRWQYEQYLGMTFFKALLFATFLLFLHQYIFDIYSVQQIPQDGHP
jgi:hypothetical protein